MSRGYNQKHRMGACMPWGTGIALMLWNASNAVATDVQQIDGQPFTMFQGQRIRLAYLGNHQTLEVHGSLLACRLFLPFSGDVLVALASLQASSSIHSRFQGHIQS